MNLLRSFTWQSLHVSTPTLALLLDAQAIRASDTAEICSDRPALLFSNTYVKPCLHSPRRELTAFSYVGFTGKELFGVHNGGAVTLWKQLRGAEHTIAHARGFFDALIARGVAASVRKDESLEALALPLSGPNLRTPRHLPTRPNSGCCWNQYLGATHEYSATCPVP